MQSAILCPSASGPPRSTSRSCRLRWRRRRASHPRSIRAASSPARARRCAEETRLQAPPSWPNAPTSSPLRAVSQDSRPRGLRSPSCFSCALHRSPEDTQLQRRQTMAAPLCLSSMRSAYESYHYLEPDSDTKYCTKSVTC